MKKYIFASLSFFLGALEIIGTARNLPGADETFETLLVNQAALNNPPALLTRHLSSTKLYHYPAPAS